MNFETKIRDDLQTEVESLPELDNLIFGKNFEYLLKKRGLTSSRFAELLGIEQSSTSQWKKGKQFPRPQIQFKIIKFFGVTWDEIMTQNIQENEIRKRQEEVVGNIANSEGEPPPSEDIRKMMKELEKRLEKLENITMTQ